MFLTNFVLQTLDISYFLIEFAMTNCVYDLEHLFPYFFLLHHQHYSK